MGNRVRKFVDKTGTNDDVTTWYVRDASGNVMAIYDNDNSTQTIKQREVPLYGSDRVGHRKPDVLRDNGGNGANNQITDGDIFSRDLGTKQYELKDHLGNVRVVFGDIKKNANDVAPFKASVVSYSGYYPFGMQMPEETDASPLYRYGYNGKEKDGELNGEGNSYDYGMRIYDPRAGRFLSVDPITKDYPTWSPYPFAMNRVIDGVDLDGLEYLRADESRVEFKYGELRLRIENFSNPGYHAINNFNNALGNWRPDCIGSGNLTIGVIIDPNAEFKDIDRKFIPKALLGQNLDTKSEIEKKSKQKSFERKRAIEVTDSKGIQLNKKIGLYVEAAGAAVEAMKSVALYFDNIAYEGDLDVAKKVVDQVNMATNMKNKDGSDLIPKLYQTRAAMVNIMNYVLLGENNTYDPEISRIGRNVFEAFNPPKNETKAPADATKVKQKEIPKP